MKTHPANRGAFTRTALCFILLPSAFCLRAPAQSTAFTYQGRLDDGANPATGIYDLRFTMYDSVGGGGVAGGPITNAPVAVTNGLFTVTLDFGAGVFTGANRWLEIGVRTNGGGGFSLLSPRQALSAAPYAITASTLSGTLPAAQLSGAIPPASLAGTYSGSLTFNNAGNSFSGSGSGLTALNASQLADGTVPDARLAGNVARTNQVWLLGGNAGTAPGSQFLGTTDNQPLEIKVNGLRALRVEPTPYSPNLIGGHALNMVSNGLLGVTIAGGGNEFYPHQAAGSFAAISGGLGNRVDGIYGTVGGGYFNFVGTEGAVGGGRENQASGLNATVPGGERNLAGGSYSFAAGRRARATHTGTFVWPDSAGANFNSTAADQFLVRAAGGVGINTADPGGASLAVQGDTTLGGNLSLLGSLESSQALNFNLNLQRALRLEPSFTSPNLIGGYAGNVVSNGFVGAAILGGGLASAPNRVGESYAAVLGGVGNTAHGYASVAMGNGAMASSYGAIAAGSNTIASGYISLALGSGSSASGGFSSAMGDRTSAKGDASTAIGRLSVANGAGALAAGDNAAAGGDGAVALGRDVVADGGAATALGFNTTAAGTVSAALGHRARALHAGTFVWADSLAADFASTGDNQFLVRAVGGVGINTNHPGGATVGVNGTVHASSATATSFEAHGAAAGYALDDRTTGAVGRWTILAANGSLAFFSTAQTRMQIDAGGNVSANSFAPTSDRNAKENFQPVDAQAVLAKVAALPLSEWNFKGDAGTTHVGPMAQDFHAAFGLGANDTTIATVDADGVALAAIQGLNHKLEQKETEIAELKIRLEKLERFMSQTNGGAK